MVRFLRLKLFPQVCEVFVGVALATNLAGARAALFLQSDVNLFCGVLRTYSWDDCLSFGMKVLVPTWVGSV
jgi:hypothetical protein